MANSLTEAGKRMLSEYLRLEDAGLLRDETDAFKRGSWMSLPSGSGAAKATMLRLRSQGYIEGRWNMVRGMGGGGLIRITDAGREAASPCPLHPRSHYFVYFAEPSDVTVCIDCGQIKEAA